MDYQLSYSKLETTTFRWLIYADGTVKIRVFDNFNIFLTFNNNEDFNVILYKRAIDLDGYQIWFQKWSPDFKLEEDIPIVPVWVLLPGLPFHMHTWHYVKQITEAAGIPIELDTTTKTMNRPSMAKVRAEIDLMKPLVHKVWIGTEYENDPIRAQSDESDKTKKGEQGRKQKEVIGGPDFQRGREPNRRNFDKDQKGKSALPNRIEGKNTIKDQYAVLDQEKDVEREEVVVNSVQNVENEYIIQDDGEGQTIGSDEVETIATPCEGNKSVTYLIKDTNDLQVITNQEE
ncbi:uncharacterized protein LOC132628294 [Lycium barbarum]|uniref:uncharacterized protein LOC132628294 n=1 Tax=Lycium barbarum TaxID=112863 RepID=UPI00293F02F1|nr:uncharacterized protein LOC132628294 [Lycium barbarum]